MLRSRPNRRRSFAGRVLRGLTSWRNLALLVVVLPLLAGSLAAEDRYALIIGSDYKNNQAGIPPLDLCEADAKLMQETLKGHGGFKDAKVLLGRMVTASNVENAIEALADQANSDDTVVLYFSGHGTYQRDAGAPNGMRNYIVMYDRPHVPDNTLDEWVREIPTKKLVWIFDCCYSGGIAKKGKNTRGQGDVPVNPDQPGKVIQNGRDMYFDEKAIVASSDANETSIEVRGNINHGIFTYWFARGIQVSNGDLNKDGTVTIMEAFEWAKPRVVDMAKRFNHRQTPQLSGRASGILIAGKTDPEPPAPVKPDPQPEPEPEDEPEPGPTPPDLIDDDPVEEEEEPEVVEHEDKATAVIYTTILQSMAAGPTEMDPHKMIDTDPYKRVDPTGKNQDKQEKLDPRRDRRVKVTFGDKQYETRLTWIDEGRLRRELGEQIPLGTYNHKGRRYVNRVAKIETLNVPTGVYEIKIEADGYPMIRERLGVQEEARLNKLFVPISLSGFGTIQGKVFLKSFEQPLAGQEIWMPVVKTTNMIHKMKSASDGSFWFLNLPPGDDYFIKASFLESLPLDNKYLDVDAGQVTKVDVVLTRRLNLDRVPGRR